MKRVVYQSMFASLSALLLAVLFVLQPTDNPELKNFQGLVQEQFAQATMEVLGDLNYVEPIALVWSSVESFYEETADQTIALIEDDALVSFALMFNAEYLSDVEVASSPIAMRAPTEEAVYNIIPMSEAETLLDPLFNEDLAYVEEFGGTVAGESITVDEQQQPEIKKAPVVWMTITDSITGYPYCVGIFNATVNSYPGVCATEEESAVVRQN